MFVAVIIMASDGKSGAMARPVDTVAFSTQTQRFNTRKAAEEYIDFVKVIAFRTFIIEDVRQ